MTAANTHPAPAVYTAEQAAEILQLNKVTLYRYIREGKLPARRIGVRGYRLTQEDIDTFLSNRTTDEKEDV